MYMRFWRLSNYVPHKMQACPHKTITSLAMFAQCNSEAMEDVFHI